MSLYNFKRWILSAIYPNRCPFCNKEIRHDEYLCEKCALELLPPPENYNDIFPISALISVTTYGEFAEKAIFALKNGNNGYAASMMAYLISQRLILSGLAGRISLVTAVPLHKMDKRIRGYNQSELVACELAELLNKPFCRVLKKIKITAPQKSLKGAKRIENVKGAFAANEKRPALGHTVLIVDDVSTTGSTLKECAIALKNGGAAEIFGAVFAKTKYEKRENKSDAEVCKAENHSLGLSARETERCTPVENS